MRRGYVDWSGGQVHYRDAGSGAAVILLGGAPRSGGQFAPVMEGLAARGLRAIAPDMPGFGMSDRLPAGASIADIAGFLPPLLDALGIGRAHIFGLHSGGKVAVACAAAYPERIAGLILAGKSHSLVPDMDRRNAVMRAAVEDRYFARGAEHVDGPEALRGWAAAWRELTKSWWDDALQRDRSGALMRATEGKLIDDLLARRTVRDFYAANFAFDFAATLAHVAAPTLIVEITSAAEDETIGRQAGALARHAGSATATTLQQTDASEHFFYAGIQPLVEMIAGAVEK